MVILHIANIKKDMCNGVCVVVPQHITAQQQILDTVGFINITNCHIDGMKNQFKYVAPFLVDELPHPFGKPDLVIFHELYRPAYLEIAKNLIANKIAYIIVPHGEMSASAQKKKWLKKKVANLLLFNFFIRNAIAIQYLSQYELDNTKFNQKKIIETNGISIPVNMKKEFLKCGMKFVYIGRLDVYHKGLDLMLTAIGRIKEFLLENKCQFYIFGPDCKGRYSQVEKLIQDNNIHELVELNHEILGQKKEDILLESDCFIQTSRFEGMPMGILEAMSYGIPCLVTEGTTVSNIVRENDAGWSGATSIDSIAVMLKQAIEEKNTLVTKSKNARRIIEENFRWDIVAKLAIEQYKLLVSQI